jgi:hypothetical protein
MTSPPPEYAVPPAPAWAGDPVTYGAALDEWLAQLRLRCDDPAWLEWYRRMHGEPDPVRVELPPYPQAGDKEGWEEWWRRHNAAFADAGAAADGINDPPAPKPDPARRRRRRRFRQRVESVVRDLLAAELPEAVALLLERRAGQ